MNVTMQLTLYMVVFLGGAGTVLAVITVITSVRTVLIAHGS